MLFAKIPNGFRFNIPPINIIIASFVPRLEGFGKRPKIDLCAFKISQG